MKKLFISQPMNGKTDREILAVRKGAAIAAEARLVEPVEVLDFLAEGGIHRYEFDGTEK